MRQFDNILNSRQLHKHDGRALWKYSTSDTEFAHLRKTLMEANRLNDVDARDCALYYAEWWKRCYDGSCVSKKVVFNSIKSGQWYDEEAFFQLAKKGATLLGIRWIKSQNTLFFRTLLLQGGLPVRHISANKGAYKNFLLKILELNPESIDDFAFDATIIKFLPQSSRNDEVYECCLNIVKAIINEDKGYLTLLESNQALKEISSELRIKKQSIAFRSKKARWKTTWIFEPAQKQVRLHFGIPDMDSEEFKNAFQINEEGTQLDFEYKLYYNNVIFCKFVKKENGRFRTVPLNQSDLIWDGTEALPEIYLKDVGGKKHDCQHLLSYLPSLDKPTLWTKYSDTNGLWKKAVTRFMKRLLFYTLIVMLQMFIQIQRL